MKREPVYHTSTGAEHGANVCQDIMRNVMSCRAGAQPTICDPRHRGDAATDLLPVRWREGTWVLTNTLIDKHQPRTPVELPQPILERAGSHAVALESNVSASRVKVPRLYIRLGHDATVCQSHARGRARPSNASIFNLSLTFQIRLIGTSGSGSGETCFVCTYMYGRAVKIEF